MTTTKLSNVIGLKSININIVGAYFEESNDNPGFATLHDNSPNGGGLGPLRRNSPGTHAYSLL